VSTLVNDNGICDVETRCLVPYIPVSAHAQSSTVWKDAIKFHSRTPPRVAHLRRFSHVSTIILLISQSCSKEKRISGARKVLKDLNQRKGVDWPEATWDCWISLEYLFGRNGDVQKRLAVIAMHGRIEEERRRKAWARSGYPYAYQQAEETTVQTHPQEHFPTTTNTRVGMEVYALISAAGNGGVKRKREEKDIGVKDSPSKRAKTVEGPPYPSPVLATALTPGCIEAQGHPAEPLKR